MIWAALVMARTIAAAPGMKTLYWVRNSDPPERVRTRSARTVPAAAATPGVRPAPPARPDPSAPQPGRVETGA